MSNQDGVQISRGGSIGALRGIYNGLAPRGHIDPVTQKRVAGKPKALPMFLDFSATGEIKGQLLFGEHEGLLEFVQSVFVDNSDNQHPLVIYVDEPWQRLVIPAQSQGEFPIYSPNPLKFRISTTQTDGLIVKLSWKNVPGAFTPWGPITIQNVNATLTPTIAAVADHSGTVAVGGTSQIAIPANANRKRFTIQNPGNAAASISINFGANATYPPTDSLELFPGGTYDTAFGPLDLGNITVNAPNNGQVYIAKEWS